MPTWPYVPVRPSAVGKAWSSMHQPLHGSRSATSAVNSEQSSTPLVAASTAEQEIQPFAPAQLLMRLLSKTVK
ncbi:hypothetical protein PC116_g12854 [Phytophthora cactorum]|uniref:Uncharacterized protein n=1 Tax=Phytophthora cactorum TaxID=29920 RepID=A0A8T1AM36_9STRA|nr:hypothetical protein PC112_g23661 [Phytophthora cactorum]KAG2813347.1 hypothetical protein PC113_g23455 [Phytophthora cactorum]KAG2872501.1 hypothetical protein PC114_g26347 [Phytophthora cactorum]KAG2882495.1 hypothetical protein PC117_g26212 [Phytophthora cactorum]KAG2961808.1 hypothetical protein PC119_g25998 [Phytophthora cactorum]